MQQTSQLWSTMPGWGIVTDLTPPELIAARRLGVIRKIMSVCLIALLVVILLVLGFVTFKARDAASALGDEQVRTTQLQSQQNRYSAVTQLRQTIDSVNKQLAVLMGADVDISTAMAKVRAAAPAGTGLNDVEISVNSSGAAAAAAARSSISLNTNGHQPIGNVKLTGTGKSIAALADYVAALQQIPGVVDVVPTTNDSAGTSVQFTLSLTFTDEVLSHRFDNITVGAK